ncbi:DUF4302 domain-containing protein [Sinomicrobium pectinilyticum]|uniref:DUF4302 domain-containing protein n=1 Tax=Sinomicrobium pectinilyticum TaxID=1084421 RepID=A0A3N0EUY7_SINP1|nr:DUF4302 domain-containing protein [Sinomicrobium pectinilyticum]RNL91700.1 DUF4302 domain-containing protein [Sinomicrobium pectinilyticum]
MKAIQKIYILVCTGMVLLSCNGDDQEQLFQDSPSGRISAREQELKDHLTSAENGWKTTYFPNNDKFGGFTLLMEFSEDGSVKMTSDIDENNEVRSSRYDLNLGATTKLTFSTRNHIHKLNNSSFPAELRGRGYEGDNEFNFYGEKDGKLHFKSVRNEVDVVFEKASAEDWNNMVLQNMKMADNLFPQPGDPVFQVIKVIKEGKTFLYNFNYNVLKRFVESTTPIDDKLVEKSFGIGFTPEGIVLNPPLELESAKFTDFLWDEEERKFVSTAENAVAEITYSNEPAYINNDYKDIGTSVYSLAFSPGQRFDQVLNTHAFKEMYSQVDKDAQKDHPEFQLQDIVIKFNKQADAPQNTHTLDFYFFYGQTQYFASYAVEFKKEDKKLKFNYLNEINGNASNFKEYLMPLIYFFTNPEGLIVNNEGRFWPQYTNSGYTLTSAEDATLRVHCASNYYRNN